MAGPIATLPDMFNLDYYNISKGRSKSVRVQIFSRQPKPKLQIAKVSDKKCVILDEIWVENIGALILHKVKIKRKYQRCLFLFCKSTTGEKEWNEMLFIDGDNSDTNRGLEQLRIRVAKAFQSGLYKMKDTSGKLAYLQCSRKYMAITPEDGIHSLKRSELVLFCSRVSASIYAKCNREISVSNEPSSCTRVIKLVTHSGEILHYTITNGTADMISREINATPDQRDPTSPLPPTPSVEPQSNHSPPLVARDCGVAPAIGERPFWLEFLVPVNPEDPPDPESIYRKDADLEPYIQDKMKHVQYVCRRKPSKRFHEFIDVVKIKPGMVDMQELQLVRQVVEPVYRKARLSRLVTEQPTISTTEFSKDNVENTLAECLKKIVRRNFEHGPVEQCPMGLTNHERETFCWRLDLVENTIEGLVGWKDFARSVMLLDNDDLEMIDEFSCKYKCQVVEVVLDHWYKLCMMRSDKCLHPATKQTIIDVLTRLEKYDLLYRLNWS